MNDNRRNFLKIGSLAGLGLASGSVLAACQTKAENNTTTAAAAAATGQQTGNQIFNMSGYKAPKLDKVRIGFVGLGMRGPHAVQRMSYIQGVEIKALCDIRPKQVDKVLETLKGT